MKALVVRAQPITDDLEVATEQFAAIAEDLAARVGNRAGGPAKPVPRGRK